MRAHERDQVIAAARQGIKELNLRLRNGRLGKAIRSVSIYPVYEWRNGDRDFNIVGRFALDGQRWRLTIPTAGPVYLAKSE